MKLYRYNTKKRTDRKFNTTGNEKNPGKVEFFSKSLEYAIKYKYTYTPEGDVNYECELEVIEIDGLKLFDLENNFKDLKTYRSFMDNELGTMLKDFNKMLLDAKKQKEKKRIKGLIEKIESGEEEKEKVIWLKNHGFQFLSDFEWQLQLISELKKMGFDGYETKEEVAIFNIEDNKDISRG